MITFLVLKATVVSPILPRQGDIVLLTDNWTLEFSIGRDMLFCFSTVSDSLELGEHDRAVYNFGFQ